MNINKIVEIINQKGYQAEVQEIVKGSTTRTGIVIGTDNIRPTIYPELLNIDDFTDEEIAEKVIELYKNNKKPIFDAKNITNADYIKKNMFITIRRPIEDNAFKTSYLDMQIVLNVKVEIDEGFASYKVQNDLADQLGFTKDIFDEAIKNMNFYFRPMGSIIGNLINEEDIPDIGMYVISTERNLHGSAALYDHILLKAIADKLNSDLVIIPSSINELIVLKYDESVSIEDMNEMVKEVNATQVAPQDRLSDHVYIFMKDSNVLSF